MRRFANRALLLALGAVTGAVQAGGTVDRAQQAGSLLIRHAGNDLELVLHGPSESFFGFDGLPEDDQQRALVISGAALLRDAGTMFRLSSAAACRIVEVRLTGEILEVLGEAGTYAPGEALERLRERDIPLGGRPAPAPSVATRDVESGARAADGSIHAGYRYRCNRADALEQIAVQIFTSFSAIGVIAVDIDRAGGRESLELDATAPLIELGRPHD